MIFSPGMVVVEIEPVDNSGLDQAVFALASIKDLGWRRAALKGIVAARLQNEIGEFSLSDTPATHARLTGIALQIERLAIESGVWS